jgi:hypothetical protein
LFGSDPGRERFEALRIVLTPFSIIGVKRLELANNDVSHAVLVRERD